VTIDGGQSQCAFHAFDLAPYDVSDALTLSAMLFSQID